MSCRHESWFVAGTDIEKDGKVSVWVQCSACGESGTTLPGDIIWGDIGKTRQNATKHRLAVEFLHGRGGPFHHKAIHAIFEKLTPRDADVLAELIRHREEDSKRDGERSARHRFGY